MLADRQHVAGLKGQRPDRRHHVVGARAQYRCDVDAAAHRQVAAQPGMRRAQRDHLAVVGIVNAVGAERNSVDRRIGVGAGHRDGDVAAAHPRREAAERDLDGGAVAGVGDQPVGQGVRPAVGGAGAADPHVGQPGPAEVLDRARAARCAGSPVWCVMASLLTTARNWTHMPGISSAGGSRSTSHSTRVGTADQLPAAG